MNIQEYIASGILESYVLGATDPEENRIVEKMIKKNTILRKEVEKNRKALHTYLWSYAQRPPQALRGNILDQLDTLDKE
ncbi:MAG: hypothetical protein NW226_10140 [Microscillaceae bacterium]|nr:hypothetical protein [Microscillaceae bacterium]